ncbi:hypothetical protein JW935_06325 [candidate division KSB1 bacterium]|nr:hypothetical protein [candidate division KSB1 bacterium]
MKLPESELQSRIRKLLVKIVQNNPSPQEIEDFALICLRFAIVFLKKYIKKGHQFLETGQITEIEGIAADCIADLFTRDAEGRYIYIARYFKDLLVQNSRQEKCLIDLRNLIAGRVKQHLTKIYENRDPIGAKIRRNILLAVRRNSRLTLLRELSEEHIVYHDNKSSKEIYFADIFEILAQTANLSQYDKSTEQLITALLANFSHHCKSAVAVNIRDMLGILREWFWDSETTLEKEQVNTVNQLQLDELARAIKKILNQLTEKLHAHYVKKDKLLLVQALSIQQALFDMSKDILHGERLGKNYIYLKKYWQDLTYDEYMENTRKVFEYFVRLFKEQLKNNLKKIF